MARRSDNTRKELKEMAISAGIALLQEVGGDGLSARAIASRIGYTVGTLYNIFEDFDDIVLHLNAATLTDMQATLFTPAQVKKKPDVRIVELAHRYADYALANPARWYLLHVSSRTKKIPEWYRKEIEASFSMVEASLLALPAMKPSVARDAARVLWAGLHGICALSISQKLERVDAAPVQALVENFVGNYLKGLVLNKNA